MTNLPAPLRLNRRPWMAALALLAAAGACAWLFLGRPPAPPAATRPPALVTTIIATPTDLPLVLATQGHLVTFNQVDVRPQTDGIVRAVHFREGDEVRAGQLLFTLDASNAEAALARAVAQAAQYRAQADDGKRDLTRTQALARSHFYSTSAVDTSASKLESLEAQFRAAQADIQTARVMLDRTRIVSSVSGRTGALNVHPGSLAQQGASLPMVTLVQFDPIGVEFTLPEGNLADLLRARAAGRVKVALQLPGGGPDSLQEGGQLTFVNNTVSPDTGTISLKASFPNAKRLLWPGAYVKVVVDAGSTPRAIALPPQAVLEGPQGRFVYLLDGSDKVSARPVTLVRLQQQRAVVEGLQGGERVVVEGSLGIKPGDTVRLKAASAALASAS